RCRLGSEGLAGAAAIRGRVASRLRHLTEAPAALRRGIHPNRRGRRLLRVESALLRDDRDLKFPEAESSADTGMESKQDQEQDTQSDEGKTGEVASSRQSADDQGDGDHAKEQASAGVLRGFPRRRPPIRTAAHERPSARGSTARFGPRNCRLDRICAPRPSRHLKPAWSRAATRESTKSASASGFIAT